jgi:hypothetical protein
VKCGYEKRLLDRATWDNPIRQAIDVLINIAWASKPDLISVRQNMLHDATKLSETIRLTQDKAMQNHAHNQWTFGRFFEHFIKLINQVIAK